MHLTFQRFIFLFIFSSSMLFSMQEERGSDYYTHLENSETVLARTYLQLTQSLITRSKNHSSILHLGCRTGKFLKILSLLSPHHEFFGVDNGSDLIRYAKQYNNGPNIDYGLSIKKLSSIRIEKFDIIICFDNFEFFENKKSFIKNCKKHLNTRGKLIWTPVCNPKNSLNQYISPIYTACNKVLPKEFINDVESEFDQTYWSPNEANDLLYDFSANIDYVQKNIHFSQKAEVQIWLYLHVKKQEFFKKLPQGKKEEILIELMEKFFETLYVDKNLIIVPLSNYLIVATIN